MGFKARMKKRTITLDELRSSRACKNQLELFERTFGDRIELTDENVRRAVDAGLDVEWATSQLKLTLTFVDKCGTKEWYVDGKLHRDGGLPAVEWANGSREWWVDGKPVRREG